MKREQEHQVGSNSKRQRWGIRPTETVYWCRAEVQSDILGLWHWLMKEKVNLHPDQVLFRIVEMEAYDCLTMGLTFASTLNLETLSKYFEEYEATGEEEIHRMVETLKVDNTEHAEAIQLDLQDQLTQIKLQLDQVLQTAEKLKSELRDL